MIAGPNSYNRAVLGDLLVQAEDANTCRVQLQPRQHHHNAAGAIHGGIILGLADVSLFAAMYMLRGTAAVNSATIDLATQFIAPGDPSRPLDAVVELLRETGRMGFLRGLAMQDETIVASFSGAIRKSSQR